MLRQVLEISKENTYLSIKRGFLVISQEHSVIAEIPIDNIAVLLLTSHSVTCSKHVLNKLSEYGAPTLLCGRNFSPQSIVLPIAGNYEFSGRLKDQIEASKPLCKNLWKGITQAKIRHQAEVLRTEHKVVKSNQLIQISKRVLSGDSDNREAYAAKIYWKSLFGEKFKRNPDALGINQLLNYGYGVLRGIVTRAICSSGLHPSIGIHHRNRYNQLCLSDDLMEPYRPLVDWRIKSLTKQYNDLTLSPEIKKEIVQISWIDTQNALGLSPLIKAVEYYTNSIVESFRTRKNVLCIPKIEL